MDWKVFSLLIDSFLFFSGLTYQELEDKVKGDPHIVVIWK